MKKPSLPPTPSSSTTLTRRSFLQRAVAVTGGLTAPQFVPARVLGQGGAVAPGSRVTVGLIGRGAMGSGHLHRLAYDPNFQLLAVCDVDKARRDAGKKSVDDIYASTEAGAKLAGCAAYNDYRDLLARDDIEAVLIATPDHWHSMQSIDAAKAGKDVYCEKPLSVTLREGRRLVETVQRYGRVFQTGTQYRSIPAIRQVCQFIRDGRMGKVKSVFTNYQPLSMFFGGERMKRYAEILDIKQTGKSYVPMEFALPAEPVPEGLDWDLWVGPAPWREFSSLYHTNPSPGVVPWSFDTAFGVTSSTWFLSHAVDVIQWALGYERSGPVEIIHPSSGQFPTITCRYENGTLIHFVDHWNMVKDLYKAVPAEARLGGLFGGLFICERGWVTTMSSGVGIEGEPESIFEEMNLKRTNEVNIGSNNHHANWLECIRTRKAPSADEEIGHRSASLGHLLNIACWVGRSLKWDPVKEVFLGDEMANRLLSRATRAPWRY